MSTTNATEVTTAYDALIDALGAAALGKGADFGRLTRYRSAAMAQRDRFIAGDLSPVRAPKAVAAAAEA